MARASAQLVARAFLALLAACLVLDAGPAQAQAEGELALLRQAGLREASGDLTAADSIVRDVLVQHPTSLTALLALDRLATARGTPADVLPAVDRLLELEPSSAIGHQTRLRALARVGDHQGLADAARAWIAVSPRVETPYREAARIWAELGDPARATRVLEQGRDRIPRADALALELGDAFVAAGDATAAAREWSRAVGPDGRGTLAVQRRLQELPNGGAGVVRPLLAALAAARAPGQTRAAALLAVDAGLEAEARGYSADLAGQLTGGDREAALLEVARRADGAGLYALAAWAYDTLLRGAGTQGGAGDSRALAGGTLSINARIAELALLAGDTALAAQAFQRLEGVAPAGSPERRQAVAMRVHVVIRDGGLETAAAQVDSFRSEFSRAPELDALAGALALRYLDAGDAGAAERAVAGLAGPRASLARARLHVRAGDPAQAREELMRAAPQLQGREATETIALAALMARVTPAGAEHVARAVTASGEERYELLRAAPALTAGLREAERAAVLDFLAGLAESSSLPGEAAALRRIIVAELPRTHEAPAAMLALARSELDGAAGDDGTAGDEVARVLLERLIVEHPRSALAPQARSELARLRQPAATAREPQGRDSL
jgi:hypothetical protein